MLRRLVGDLPPESLGFDPRPVCMNLWWTKWFWGRFFADYFRFPFPVSFHECSKLIFIYVLLLSEGQMGESRTEKYFNFFCVLCCIVCNCCWLVVCIVVVVLCVFVVLCVHCCFFYFSAGLLARSQHPEGPATGHLDTGFSRFPCVYKQMLRWFPRFQAATTCFSCSSPDLNLVVTNLMFCLHVR